jgi:hypothetical protein
MTERIPLFIAARREGLSDKQIAARYGVTACTVMGVFCTAKRLGFKVPSIMRYLRGSLAERFWHKVNKDGPVHPELGTKCWIWIGAIRSGYGRVWDIAGEIGEPNKQWQAQRAAYALTRESLGDVDATEGRHRKGMDVVVRHRCDNSICVNPDHLEPGTQAQNIGDAVARGRFQVKTCTACGEKGHNRRSAVCAQRKAAA